MKKQYQLDKFLSRLHTEYSFGKLEEKQAAKDPFTQFVQWFEDAFRAKVTSLNAVMLATASEKGHPSARIVLVKSFDRNGFVFYCDYRSRKAREMSQNPRAEAVFYWPKIERQIRIFGKIKKISKAESRKYFLQRPRASQIGAWSSRQSAPIRDRKTLELQYQKSQEKFSDMSVPYPEFWGGYRLIPQSYEFWQGRASRLNDRILYTKSGGRWKRQRLQP